MLNVDAIRKLINQVNPTAKAALNKIIAGQYVRQVRCNSKKCKGKIIGYLNKYNEPTSISRVGGLFSTRARLDGKLGFECGDCGNDTRLANTEKGIVGLTPPTEEDLEIVFSNIKSKKYKENTNGFTVESFKE